MSKSPMQVAEFVWSTYHRICWWWFLLWHSDVRDRLVAARASLILTCGEHMRLHWDRYMSEVSPAEVRLERATALRVRRNDPALLVFMQASVPSAYVHWVITEAVHGFEDA